VPRSWGRTATCRALRRSAWRKGCCPRYGWTRATGRSMVGPLGATRGGVPRGTRGGRPWAACASYGITAALG
jgi:hypothetical protein